MTPTEVIEVNRFTGSHLVYNLTTSDHWFTGNGIALHNCRCTMLLEIENEPTEMGNRQYKNPHLAAAAEHLERAEAGMRTLMQAACADGQFCMQTHKPGLCKGQKRGESEPGQQDATKATPAEKAQIAVKGLGQAIQQATAVAQANAVSNPKLAAMARKAVSDYQKALRPHQQTLKQAAQANARAGAQGKRDVREQDAIDRKNANAAKREEKKRETLQKRAEAIIARRKEAAKVAKMTPKQRAAYGKAKTAQARAKRAAAEAKTLKQAGKG